MNKKKNSIVYIGRSNNGHDQKFVRALSEIFKVDEIYLCNSERIPLQTEVFSNAVLVVAGPLTDAVSAIPTEVGVPILGISHAFDLNIEFEKFPMHANVARCKAIITDCRYISSMLQDTYKFQGKIYEIPWGCDQEFFSQAEIVFERKPKIIVTRNWFTNYGNETILAALKILELRNTEFECTFIGDGPLLENQKMNWNLLSESSKIRFLGRQDSSEIRDAMTDNWMYISAASSDGTSISLLEAMAAGMICITTDFPSNCEWLEHSISGFTFPIGDSLVLASLIEQVSLLGVEERKEITQAAERIITEKGNWVQNREMFKSAAIAVSL